MIKKVLELDFLDGVNRVFKISLQDPKENLEDIEVLGAMDAIVGENIFLSNGTDLRDKKSARYIETTTTMIDF